MESKDLDKFFQDAFEHAQETPNNRVWEGIEQELAKEKKVIPFYIKYRTQLSIAATFLLFFGVGLTFYKKPMSSSNDKLEEVLSAIEKQTAYPDPSTIESVNESVAKKPAETLSEIVETTTLAKVAKEKRVKEQSSRAIDNSDDKIEDKIQKEEILQLKNIVASVAADVEITQPFIEEVKTLDPISSDVQTSFAYTEPKEEVKSSLVTRVLNGITKNIISKNIDIREDKEIEFRNDEEGSLTLNIINSFARK